MVGGNSLVRKRDFIKGGRGAGPNRRLDRASVSRSNMKIFSDYKFTEAALHLLAQEAETHHYELLFAGQLTTTVLAQGAADPHADWLAGVSAPPAGLDAAPRPARGHSRVRCDRRAPRQDARAVSLRRRRCPPPAARR